VPVRPDRQKTSASEEAGSSNRCRYRKCSGEAAGRNREAAEKMTYSVILSEAKNLSSIYYKRTSKERFFASLRMTAFLVFL
jgi:hypothetical protein